MRVNQATTTGNQALPLQFAQVLKDPDLDLANRIATQIAEKMSPAGALGLPALLDERRIRYGIPDEAFEEEALFDRVYVWQIEPRHVEGAKTFVPGGQILLPETQQKRVLKESSRGIIVSIGLASADSLHSHGVAVGHIVNLVRMSPWHKLIANYGGHEMHLMVLRAGDITGSEDLVRLKKEGKVKVSVVNGEHRLTDEAGVIWTPVMSWIDDSY